MPEVSSVQRSNQSPIGPHGSYRYFDTTCHYQPEQGHFIEDSVTVYLRLDDKSEKWIVDGPSIDGYPLDSHDDNNPQNRECTCEDATACDKALEYGHKLPLPTAEQLMHLLAESLGYTLTKKETI